MAHCTVCTLPEGKFGVTLSADGRCNYCAYWSEHGAMYQDWDRLLPAFARRLEKVRGKYEYDALVGLSGGKDSVYVLYKLVTEYKLKVLAVTFENGALNEWGRQNIARIVEALKVDHLFYGGDRELHREFYKAAYERFGDPCIGCAIPMYNVVLKLCQDRRIPFFIHGRSPFQMFRNLYEGSTDAYITMTRASLEEHSFERLGRLHQEIDGHVQTWLASLFDDPAMRQRVHREFFLDPTTLTPDFAPEFLGYFIFHPYDEEHMKRVIEKAVSYQRGANDGLLTHGDCDFHDAAEYLFEQIHGSSPALMEVAAMLRRGLITRERGQAIIAKAEESGRNAEPSLMKLCAHTGVQRQSVATHVEQLKSRGNKFACR